MEPHGRLDAIDLRSSSKEKVHAKFTGMPYYTYDKIGKQELEKLKLEVNQIPPTNQVRPAVQADQ